MGPPLLIHLTLPLLIAVTCARERGLSKEVSDVSADTVSYHARGLAVTLILGVDIGAAGALALLDVAGELVDVADMPVLTDGPSNRRAVNPALLAAIVTRWRRSRAFVEFVGARPGEGAVGAFAFGRTRGVCEGVLAALNIPAAHIVGDKGSLFRTGEAAIAVRVSLALAQLAAEFESELS